MKNYTVITDPGIDDLIALLLFQKLSVTKNVNIVSCFGNIPERSAFQNAKDLIGLLNSKWMLSHGSALPINGKLN